MSFIAIVPRVDVDGLFFAIGAATFAAFPIVTDPPTIPKAAKLADYRYEKD